MRCRTCGEFTTQPVGSPKSRLRVHIAAALWHLHEARRALEEQGKSILVGVVSGAIRAMETLGELALEDTQH